MATTTDRWTVEENPQNDSYDVSFNGRIRKYDLTLSEAEAFLRKAKQTEYTLIEADGYRSKRRLRARRTSSR